MQNQRHLEIRCLDQKTISSLFVPSTDEIDKESWIVRFKKEGKDVSQLYIDLNLVGERVGDEIFLSAELYEKNEKTSLYRCYWLNENLFKTTDNIYRGRYTLVSTLKRKGQIESLSELHKSDVEKRTKKMLNAQRKAANSPFAVLAEWDMYPAESPEDSIGNK